MADIGVYTGVGGVATGGSAPTEYVEAIGAKIAFAYFEVPTLLGESVGSGGIALGGGATTSYEAGAASTTWEYTGSGGITLSGAAALVEFKVYPASGTITVSGAATAYKVTVRTYLASGLAQLTGAAAAAKVKAFTGIGGIALSGAATTAFVELVLAMPIADITDGAWLPSTPAADLYAMIDEAPPANDSDYIFTGTDSSEFEVRLATIDDAGVNTDHSILVRAKGAGKTLTLKVYQNTTLIATVQQALTGTETTYTLALDPADVANITDRSDVRIRGSVA